MKNLLAIAVICTLTMLVVGCSGNNVGTSPSLPEAVEGAAGAGAQATAEAAQIDSHSNGGSSLAAAAPYGGDGKAGAVQQNVNPTPFIQSSVPMKAGMSMPASTGVTLVSRADGTMYGATDMSPAGAGPGMQGSTSGATIPGKQSNKGAVPK